MGPPDFNMALAAETAHSRLRTEVDELASEVSLILGHVLVERRGKAWVIPSSGLGVMVDKVYSGCVGESHLPAARQRAKLRYWLLLNLTVCVVLTAVESNILLATGVDPGRRTGIVVDEVWAALGSPALLPERWQLATSGACSPSVHHGSGIASRSSSRWRGAAAGRARLHGGRAATGTVFGQGSVLVSGSFGLSGFVAAFPGTVGSRAVPARGSSVVVDIVCSSKVILTPLPPSRKATLGVLKWTQLAGRSRCRRTALGRSRCRASAGRMRRAGAARNTKAVAVGRRHGRSGSVFVGRSGQGRNVGSASVRCWATR